MIKPPDKNKVLKYAICGSIKIQYLYVYFLMTSNG